MSRRYIPKDVRERVKNRFGGRCSYCGEKPSRIHIDHLMPVACGYIGDNDIRGESNLMPSCPSCNNYKNTLTLENFRKDLEDQVRQLERHLNWKLAKRYGLVKETGKTKVEFYFEYVQRTGTQNHKGYTRG